MGPQIWRATRARRGRALLAVSAGALALVGAACDSSGGGEVLGALQAFGHRLLHGGSGRDHVLAVGGEHLRVQVLAGAMDRQAGHTELADVGASGLGATQAGFVLVHRHDSWKRIGKYFWLFVMSAAMDGRFHTQGQRTYAFLASFRVIFSPE